MNQKQDQNRSRSFAARLALRGRSRRGISLFEVLISILVAAIGVFGVLVLIPFAVRNAQLGIDRELAINAAKNFNADFQAYGYQNPDGWYDDSQDPQFPSPPVVPIPGVSSVEQPPPTATDIQFGWPYIIDPTWAITNQTASGNYGQFPSVSGMPADMPLLNIANLRQPGTGTALNVPLAQRINLQPDGLLFDEPARELDPPRQLYYEIGGVQGAKRQHEGRYSSLAFVVPDDDFGRQYRMYTLVRKTQDRIQERVFEVIDPDPAVVNQPAANMRIVKTDFGNPRTFEQISLGGGDLRLSEITATASVADDEQDQIRAYDWLMLISYYRLPGDTSLYDDIHIDFYRVVHASRTSPDANAGVATGQGVNRGAPTGAERTFNITVQGSDFDLYRDWSTRANGQRTEVPTYAILLPGVLAVYERSFRTEPASTWQNNN